MSTSVWWQGRPTAQTERRPTDEADTAAHEYDVVVVGAGVTGLSTATLLARAGRSVLVVEARHPAAVTSGRTTGKVSALQGTTLSELLHTASRPQVEAYVASTTAAREWVADFCEREGVAAQRRRAVTYAAEPDQVETVAAEHRAAASLGLPVAWQPRPELPVPAYVATTLDDQLQLDPVALVLALQQAAEAAGARVVTGLRVRRLRQRRDGVHLETDTGTTARGRAVVLATGTSIVDRRLHFARLSAQRSYLLAFDTPEAPDVMALSAGSPNRSWRGAEHDGRPLLLVGGEGHVTGRGTAEAERVAILRRWAAEHFPEAREVAAWSAQDYLSLDGLPLVGSLGSPSPAVHVATGFRKWGLTSGVAAALALAGRLTGSPPPWAEPLYRRPPRLRDVPAFGSVQAGVATGGAKAAAQTGADAVGDRGGRPARCGTLPVCTHLGGVLRWNDHEETWDCPLHGSRFGSDGEVLEGPATRRLRRFGGGD